MNTTIEKIDTTFMNTAITAMDVAGFRLFLRHNIYNLVTENGNTIIQELSEKIRLSLNADHIILNGTVLVYNYNNQSIIDQKAEIEKITTMIIDTIRSYLYEHADQILYQINYDIHLDQHTKNAYKKILYSMSQPERLYFELLVNMSFFFPTISIML